MAFDLMQRKQLDELFYMAFSSAFWKDFRVMKDEWQRTHDKL